MIYHLRAGDIVIALDDRDLANDKTQAVSVWNNYLLGRSVTPSQGWCFDSEAFHGKVEIVSVEPYYLSHSSFQLSLQTAARLDTPPLLQPRSCLALT